MKRLILKRWFHAVVVGGMFGGCLAGAGAEDQETRICVGNKVLQTECTHVGSNTGAGPNPSFLKNPVFANFEGCLHRRCFTGEVYADGFRQYIDAEPTDAERKKSIENTKKFYVGAKATILSGPQRWQTRTITAVQTRVGPDANGKPQTGLFYVFDKPVAGVEETGRDKKDFPYRSLGLLVDKSDPSFGSLPSVTNIGDLRRDAYALVHDDLPPDTTGKTALLLQPGTGRERRLEFNRVHSMDVNDCNRPYIVAFWAKAKGPSASVNVCFDGSGFPSQKIAITQQWKQYQHTYDLTGRFPVSESKGVVSFHVSVEGAPVLLDDIELRSEGYRNPTPYTDAFVESLRYIQPGRVRSVHWGGPMPGLREHLLDIRQQPANAERFGPGFENVTEKNILRMDAQGAPWFFLLCEYLGAEPWYCLPGALDLEDMDLFMEYIGAPADVGYGKIRAAQGHPKPWLETLSRIRIEFANEVFLGGTSYNGPDYWHDLIDRAKKSKWYRPNLVFVAGGQNVSTWLNLRLIQDVPNAFNIAIAPYIAHFYPKNIREVCPTSEDCARWMVSLVLRQT